MRFELHGSVVVNFRTREDDEVQALSFAAHEFSAVDTDNGFVPGAGQPVYRGVWAASEENVVLRLTLVADRDGFREKHWEIFRNGERLIAPHIAADKISCGFVEADDA